jgi:hypothetical protein
MYNTNVHAAELNYARWRAVVCSEGLTHFLVDHRSSGLLEEDGVRCQGDRVFFKGEYSDDFLITHVVKVGSVERCIVINPYTRVYVGVNDHPALFMFDELEQAFLLPNGTYVPASQVAPLDGAGRTTAAPMADHKVPAARVTHEEEGDPELLP